MDNKKELCNHFIIFLLKSQKTFCCLILLFIYFSPTGDTNKSWLNLTRCFAFPVLSNADPWQDDLEYGVVFEKDGSTYRGYFLNEYKHGKGVIKYTDGSAFEGIFVYGAICGKGSYIGADLREVYGHFYSLNKQDQSIIPKDGTSISDYSKTVTWTGEGYIFWPDGRVYSGNISNGMMHGKGLLKWPNGITYEGDFLNDYLEGQGKMFDRFITEADNTIHEGCWVHDYFIPHGKTVPDEYKSMTDGILLKHPFALNYGDNPNYVEWKYIVNHVKENPVNPVTKETLTLDQVTEQGIDLDHYVKIKQWLSENAINVSYIVSKS